MKIKFLLITLVLSFSVTTALLHSFSRIAEAGAWRLCILQSARHAALDDVTQGVKQYFRDEMISADFLVKIGPGDTISDSAIPKILQEISDYDPHLIIPVGTQAAQFASTHLATIPAVFSAVTDPVGSGLVGSLQEPGKMMTGLTDMSPVLAQLNMIRMVQPELNVLGIVFSEFEQNAVMIRDHLKSACDSMGIRLVEAPVKQGGSVTTSAMNIIHDIEALYIPTDNTIVSGIEELAKLYSRHNIPLYAADPSSVGKGAIAALSIDYFQMGIQTGAMSVRVLKGEDPANIPVEQPLEMTISINVKTAGAIALRLPMDLILAADKIHDGISDDLP